MSLLRIILTVLAVSAVWPAQAADDYTLGVVPQFEPRKLFGIWQPILDEIKQRTGINIRLQGSKDIPEFETHLAKGDFDFAYMNPYHALVAGQDQGYLPLVRDGGRSLYGILVVRKDSSFKDVKELNGAQVAFPAPNALGASLLMRAELHRDQGLKITPKYVKTHSSVYLNVVLGQTPAGGGVMGTFKQQPQEVRDQLRTIHTTRDMPPHPLGAHPRVPVSDRIKITKALLEMAATQSGQALLAKAPFVKLIETSYAEYEMMKDWGLEDYYVKSE